MDWGKTLSSEQPKAADLAFLPPVSRPTLVQAAKQRQRSPGAQFRPGQQLLTQKENPLLWRSMTFLCCFLLLLLSSLDPASWTPSSRRLYGWAIHSLREEEHQLQFLSRLSSSF
uniref:Uncharacterized protein n=1 Tax=Callithrix jacchus TaxID=9483 RepID=A0A8I3W2A3_CALJA